MIKKILVSMMLLGFNISAFGQNESREFCTYVDKYRFPSLVFNEKFGVLIDSQNPDAFDFLIPLKIDGKINPNFDRMYAMLLKYLTKDSRLDLCYKMDVQIPIEGYQNVFQISEIRIQNILER